MMTDKAHQRVIREQQEQEEKNPTTRIGQQISLGLDIPIPDMKIGESIVKPCSYNQARSVIDKYEWLGTMAQRTTHTLGLFFQDELAGVVCFAIPPTPQAAMGVAGEQYADKVKTLARGACVWWAHPHSASKLIAGAVRWMSEYTPFRFFVAYSDQRAGEIGTVYQATNWLYTGETAGDTEYFIDGDWKSGRSARHKSYERRGIDYKQMPSRKGNPKHRYVFIGGNKREQKKFREVLRYDVLPYPKR
jgi:hypothetical protein